MKRIILLAVLLCAFLSDAYSQGVIRGKITDENGESIIGATVVKKSDPSAGAVTDFDGNYSLKISDATPQVIVVSFISYDKIEFTVNPKSGEVIIRNFTMKPSANDMKEVEIEAKAIRANDQYMETLKKKSATTIDYVSSETMKKTGDNTVIAAVARVTGVSSTNNGFITVRGIGDRYVKTAVNGARIPTLDPFTNNIKLDIFPASLVDNIMITKTASPDLPGDWAGAYLSVETKDYPDQLNVSVETQFGYNTQASLRNILSSERSSTDWLGYDSDLRDYDHTKYVRANANPSQYQELIALGLGGYYSSLGVNGWLPGTASGDTYFKLGLVQLGLLPAALFNDPTAVANAKSSYESGNFRPQAFSTLNSGNATFGKDFAGNWNLTNRKAPLNFSQTISLGNQTTIFGKTFGFIAGFRYSMVNQFDPEATSSRLNLSQDGDVLFTSNITEELAKETNGWSALFNAACKLNSNNSISILFMPNVNGVNNTRFSRDFADPDFLTYQQVQFYEERKQFVYQLKSENYLPVSKIKMETNVSYTDGSSKAPDFKTIAYTSTYDLTGYAIGGERPVNRYFRYLDENVLDARFSAEKPISKNPDLVRKIKAGGAYQYSIRNSDQYNYFVTFGPRTNYTLQNGDLNQFLSPDHFGIRNGIDALTGAPYSTQDMFFEDTNTPSNFVLGNSQIAGGFVMTDYAINKRLRVSGGLRVEYAKFFTDAVLYDSLGFAADDPRRRFGTDVLALKPADLERTSYLPSFNLIYKVRDNERTNSNLRLNYSRTVARPSLREMSDMFVFDYELRAFVFGNSSLKMVDIDNYDLRYETYFKNGDNISVSVFYKNFINHIEVTDAPQGYTWENVDKSFVQGIELEGRKVITKNFDVRANLTLVRSETSYIQRALLITNGNKDYLTVGKVTRTMFGQAPYVVNCMLNYNFEKIGLTATGSYNVQGPRLVITAFNENFEVYEQPRHMVDLKFMKKLGKNFSSALTVRDLLNAPITRRYNFSDETYDYDSFRWGSTWSLAITYKIQ
jgi:hypothetical protein